MAIIGANGAGKSTLLKAVTGLISARREAMRFAGDAIGGLPAAAILKLGVAMVPRGPQAVSLAQRRGKPAHRRRQPARQRAVDVGEASTTLFPVLRERRLRNPSTALSGGQQQMVAIGRALMSNPRLLLCDEISLGLAPIVIKDIYAALPRIKSRRRDDRHRGAGHRTGAGRRRPRLLPARRPHHPDRQALSDLTREAIQEAYFGH